jgi:hypothetical protein
MSKSNDRSDSLIFELAQGQEETAPADRTVNCVSIFIKHVSLGSLQRHPLLTETDTEMRHR